MSETTFKAILALCLHIKVITNSVIKKTTFIPYYFLLLYFDMLLVVTYSPLTLISVSGLGSLTVFFLSYLYKAKK